MPLKDTSKNGATNCVKVWTEMLEFANSFSIPQASWFPPGWGVMLSTLLPPCHLAWGLTPLAGARVWPGPAQAGCSYSLEGFPGISPVLAFLKLPLSSKQSPGLTCPSPKLLLALPLTKDYPAITQAASHNNCRLK